MGRMETKRKKRDHIKGKRIEVKVGNGVSMGKNLTSFVFRTA
jgi:hypothetical protein